MNRFDAIVFDFDGVLAESVEVKTRAFAAMYAPYGAEIEARVVAFHQAHGGVSRVEKFRYFHEHFLKRPLTEAEEKRLAAEFGARVEALVAASPWVAGAEDFLRGHHATLPLFVASGTPEAELHRILRQRRMAHYFRGAFGSPAKKGEILSRILAEGGYAPERVLMVGDSRTDWEGARQAGTLFLGRGGADDVIFPPEVVVMPDLIGLGIFIGEA